MSTLHRRPNMPVDEFLSVVRNGLENGQSVKEICATVDSKWPNPTGKVFSNIHLSMKLAQIRTRLSDLVLTKAAKQRKVTIDELRSNKEFSEKMDKFLDQQVPSLRTGRKSTSLLEGIDLSIFDEDEQELLNDEVE